MNEQLHNLKNWISNNNHRLTEYHPSKMVGHEAIDTVKILELVVSKIKKGNLNAIEIGCDFVLADFKTPFSKITKSHIYNALKKQVNYIDKKRRMSLSDLAIKCIELRYPPQEAKELMKLIKSLGKEFTSHVAANSNPTNCVGQKHVEYLQLES